MQLCVQTGSKRLPFRAAVREVVEALEARQYLTGLAYGLPVNTATAPLGLSPVAATLFPFVTGSKRADLLVANSTDSVSVLLSNGDGTFSSKVATVPVVGAPVALAVSDLNGDGIPDIVAGTGGSSSAINIIFGKGNGTFKTPTAIPSFGNNHAIAIAPFVKGGPEDIISVSNSASPANNVALYFLDHSGNASEGGVFSLPFGSASAVATGDFNGDGSQDFAVVGQQAHEVAVFLGNGNGTFQQSHVYGTGPGATSIAVGNFRKKTINGLPELDIVTADSTGGEVSFLANNGNGTFAAPVNSLVAGSPTGGGPLSASLTDLNGDGIPDLICLMGPGSSDQATALLGNGNGTFRTGATLPIPGGSRTAVATGDLVGGATPSTALVLTSTSQITSLLPVHAGPAHQLAFATEPAGTTAAGTLAPIAVNVEDSNGTLVTSDHSNVTLAIVAGPTGATLGGTTTAAAINGVATFSNLSLHLAGSYTLKATDGSLTAATSIKFTVTPAAASKMVFKVGPTATVAGKPISPAVVLDITDAFGNIVTGYSSKVTVAVQTGPTGGGLTGSTFVAAKAGVATFSNLLLTKAGTYTLKVAGGSLTSAVSASFKVNPAAASKLVVTRAPTTGKVATALLPAVTVAIEDAFGNLVTTDHSNVSISIATGATGAILSGTLVEAVLNGVAAYGNLKLSKAGTYTLKVTDGKYTAATSAAFKVS